MIFKQGGKIVQWRKGQSYQQIVLEKANIHMPQNEAGPLHYMQKLIQ